MVFADLFFIYCFLPLCLICYLLARSIPAKNGVLVVFSLVFYAWGEPLWILLLLFSSLLNWAVGLVIERTRGTPGAKAAVAGGIIIDIALLVVFKYSGFLVEPSPTWPCRCRKSGCPLASAFLPSRPSPMYWTAIGSLWRCRSAGAASCCISPCSPS